MLNIKLSFCPILHNWNNIGWLVFMEIMKDFQYLEFQVFPSVQDICTIARYLNIVESR